MPVTPEVNHTLSCEDAIAFIAESPMGHAEVDSEGRFVWINDAYCRALNAPREVILGTKFAQWTHPDDLAVDKQLAEAVKAGQRTGYELAKRYKRWNYPPNNPNYVWGLLVVSGKWSQEGKFLGYRVTYRVYDRSPKGWSAFKVECKEYGLWLIRNWKSAITIAAIVSTLLFGGSEKLLSILKKAKEAQQSVDSVLQPEEP